MKGIERDLRLYLWMMNSAYAPHRVGKGVFEEPHYPKVC